jgi:hypothetical protein
VCYAQHQLRFWTTKDDTVPADVWRTQQVPGNHEAWLRSGSRDTELYIDSIAILLALRQVRGCLFA